MPFQHLMHRLPQRVPDGAGTDAGVLQIPAEGNMLRHARYALIREPPDPVPLVFFGHVSSLPTQGPSIVVSSFAAPRLTAFAAQLAYSQTLVRGTFFTEDALDHPIRKA